jgi:hypothetical protein
MKLSHTLLAAALCSFTGLTHAQLFVNLDFEQATIAPTPVGGETFPADPAQCFPGWTVGNAGFGAPTSVAYNGISVGGPMVSLLGPDFPNLANFTPLQGYYSVYMQYYNDFGPPTLSQTGLIPAGAVSINFLVSGYQNAVVTLNGINIPLVQIAVGRVAGNIPPGLAGTTATLTFSTMRSSPGFPDNYYFDDVQFFVVPEPGPFALFALGALSLGCWRWRKSPRCNCSACPR